MHTSEHEAIEGTEAMIAEFISGKKISFINLDSHSLWDGWARLVAIRHQEDGDAVALSESLELFERFIDTFISLNPRSHAGDRVGLLAYAYGWQYLRSSTARSKLEELYEWLQGRPSLIIRLRARWASWG